MTSERDETQDGGSTTRPTARIRLAETDEKTRESEDWQRIFGWGAENAGVDEVNHYRLEGNSPLWRWVQQAEAALLAGIGNLEAEVVNLASIAVCGVNGCVYCFGAWCTLVDHTQLTTDDKLNSFLREGVRSPLLSDRERDIIEFVLKAQREPENVEAEDLDRLRAWGLDDGDLLNLVHLVDIVAFSNRVNTVFKTPLDERYKEVLRKYAPRPEETLAPPFASALAKDLSDRRATGEDYEAS